MYTFTGQCSYNDSLSSFSLSRFEWSPIWSKISVRRAKMFNNPSNKQNAQNHVAMGWTFPIQPKLQKKKLTASQPGSLQFHVPLQFAAKTTNCGMIASYLPTLLDLFCPVFAISCFQESLEQIMLWQAGQRSKIVLAQTCGFGSQRRSNWTDPTAWNTKIAM